MALSEKMYAKCGDRAEAACMLRPHYIVLAGPKRQAAAHNLFLEKSPEQAFTHSSDCSAEGSLPGVRVSDDSNSHMRLAASGEHPRGTPRRESGAGSLLVWAAADCNAPHCCPKLKLQPSIRHRVQQMKIFEGPAGGAEAEAEAEAEAALTRCSHLRVFISYGV